MIKLFNTILLSGHVAMEMARSAPKWQEIKPFMEELGLCQVNMLTETVNEI